MPPAAPQLASAALQKPLSQLIASGPVIDLIDPDKLPALAYALASGTRAPDGVLMEYGLDPADTAVSMLLDSERFTRLYLQACEDLRQEGDAQDRVRSRARRAVEKTIPSMERAIEGPAPLSERVAAFRAVAKVAGLEDPPPPDGMGEKFVINISVPGAGAQVSVVHAEMEPRDVMFPPKRENSGPVIEAVAEPVRAAVEQELAAAEALDYLDRDIFGNPLPR